MTRLVRWVQLTAQALKDAGAPFAIVRGIAVSVRTQPRFTQDVDFALAVPDDAEAERILGCLFRSGFSTFQEFNKDSVDRLATLRMVPPGGDWPVDPAATPGLVDFILASCGIEPEVVAAAEDMLIAPEVHVPVAQIPHLFAMKLVSTRKDRPQDPIDLQALIRSADPEQLQQVKELIRLINQRGYGTERDLARLYRRYLRDAGLKI